MACICATKRLTVKGIERESFGSLKKATHISTTAGTTRAHSKAKALYSRKKQKAQHKKGQAVAKRASKNGVMMDNVDFST